MLYANQLYRCKTSHTSSNFSADKANWTLLRSGDITFRPNIYYYAGDIVEYNGKYYIFDSTVATSLKKTSDHYYDGLKQEEMSDYIIAHPEWYPEIEKTSIFP